MFRHKGKSRTHIHNLRLAAILSFVAGLVNITGVLSVHALVTNVTGHFAFFAEDVFSKTFSSAIIYLWFILSFLFGSFSSNLLVEIISRKREQISHTLPMLIEIVVLSGIGLCGANLLQHGQSNLIAYALLFAMGMQNALVTKISSSRVRTTHLTGLFTDLGIELSQLFFFKQSLEQKQLHKSIFLRFIIILFFFLGCVLGGFSYKVYALKTLLFAAACLVVALYYDQIRHQYYHLRRKIDER
ncbi:MAG: YoaK family protein [Sphingobacteriaceae bacterium]